MGRPVRRYTIWAKNSAMANVPLAATAPKAMSFATSRRPTPTKRQPITVPIKSCADHQKGWGRHGDKPADSNGGQDHGPEQGAGGRRTPANPKPSRAQAASAAPSLRPTSNVTQLRALPQCLPPILDRKIVRHWQSQAARAWHGRGNPPPVAARVVSQEHRLAQAAGHC